MNRELKRKFNEYNRKYFGGRLPKDTVVDWHYELKNDCMGACHIHGITKCDQIPRGYGNGKCNGKSIILINTSLWDHPTVAFSTLLHEMVHLDVDTKHKGAAKSHGKEFRAGMLRLAKLGALNNLW